MSANMMRVIEGSERWYCRVEGCMEFTAKNVPFGYCAAHCESFAFGNVLIDKAGFPAIGTPTGQRGVFHGAPETPPRPDRLDPVLMELRMGHARLDECSDAAETQGQPLYDRISAKIQKLSDAKSEVEHMLKACGAEMDELRARAEAYDHRRQAAKYRAQRIVLDNELVAEIERLKAEVERLRAVGPRPEVDDPMIALDSIVEACNFCDVKACGCPTSSAIIHLQNRIPSALKAKALRAVGEPAGEKKSE